MNVNLSRLGARTRLNGSGSLVVNQTCGCNAVIQAVMRGAVREAIRLRAENAKSGTARLIPFEGELAELMERRKAARQIKTKDTVILSALIFHRSGEPIREFRKSWATACRKAGVKRLFHDLRRSACKNMVAAGVAQVTAMQVSGHKTDSMLRRYAIVSETDLRTALRRTQEHLATAKENVLEMAAGK